MKKPQLRNLAALLTTAGLLLGVTVINRQSYSASLSTVSDTLSNPRLSFRGALTTGNSVGSSVVIINTTQGAYPSTSSAQLVEGDGLRIGGGGSLGSYTVASTSSLSTFTITAGLGAGHADSGDDVISTQSATHTVRLTTTNAIANGRFRILVPALTANGEAGDGIPDGGYFDFSSAGSTVTCPADVGSTYDFVAGVASVSAITIAGADYHSYECAYSGTGAVGTAFNGSSQGAFSLAGIINPAPKSSHTTGTADTYKVIIQQLNSSFAVQDTTTVGIGVIEAVKVTASVPAQITFRIIGLANGTSACGVSTNVATTAASVPFGELPLDAFTNAAQTLTVSTNAVNGYSVTALANDQLGRNGGACSGDPTITSNTNCIADARGDGATMSHSNSDNWDSLANKGFAYSLHDVNGVISNGNAEAFSYSTVTGDCSGGSWCGRQFADTEGSQSAVEIFGSNTVADNENLYVCYRIIPGTTTAAGDYENFITYTATATF